MGNVTLVDDRRRGVRGGVVLALVAWAPILLPTSLYGATGAGADLRPRAQEADTLPGDTLPGDTVPGAPTPGDTLPPDSAAAAPNSADTAGAPVDSAARGREPTFPAALPVADSGYSAVVWRCDRECLLNHSAHNLLDLLEDELPGVVPLRGTYFGGPHHLAEGLVGPGFTEVRLGELRLPELSGGQLDLTRIPLAWLWEVAAVRRAGQLDLRLIPIRHRSPEAYSGVTAGTGEPNLSLIRGFFANGLGDHMAVSTGIDLLNTGGRLAGSDRLDFWGMASWMSGDGSGGAELLWRTQNVTRVTPASADGDEGGAAGGGTPQDFRRRDAYLRGRGSLGSGVRIHVAAGRSEWRETRSEGAGARADADSAAGPRVEAEGATLSVLADRPWGFGRVSFETWTGPARPTAEGRLAAGWRTPLDGLRVDAAARAGRWHRFSTRSYRGGLRWTPDLGLDLSLHASGARGSRGVPRPWLGRADSLRFEEYRGGLSADLGPYRVEGTAARQVLGRQLPFSATFDRRVEPRPDAELLALQGSLEGPILPLGLIFGSDVSPFEIDVTVRRNRSRGEGPLLYVPRNLVQSQLRFHDEFFQNDLEVTFRLDTRYRSAMTTVNATSGDVTEVPSRTTTGFSLVLRIVGARIWYRSENTGRVLAGNLAGQKFPPIRNSFGIKWEFTN